MLGWMSSHRGAPGDPRSKRPDSSPSSGEADAPAQGAAPEGVVAEPSAPELPTALALRWDGATPPPQPVVDDATLRCHACDAEIDGEPAGHGLLVFPRGDDVAREEPPLCERCALAIGMTALWGFAEEDEEG